ncbi:MAG: alpha/beta hydrolase [Clostridiales bacterium]|nr:alpha/beta hydrolase [Clostridiales bacterium]
MSGLISSCGLAYESEYPRTMREIILPYNSARRNDGYFDGEGGARLFLSTYKADSPVGAVTMVHGYTESAEKWQELIYSLLIHGFSVYAYDARGHGRSGRDSRLGGDLTLTHVDSFEDYVSDLRRLREAIPDGKNILFCHSMGGAVGAMYLERYGTGCGYDKAALNSPMIAPDRGGYPLFAAKGLCLAAVIAGKGTKRSLNSSPYPGHERFESSSASSQARFDWYEAIKSSTPEFQNYCSTYRLTLEFLDVTKKLLKKGAVEGITIPVRIYQAENDGSVINSYQDIFVSRLERGEIIRVPGSKHEIYRSDDKTLFPYWESVLEWISV